MASLIIGRKEETKVLSSFLSSKSPEFLAIYGRRRIGKTFLIKQFFKDKKTNFFTITVKWQQLVGQLLKVGKTITANTIKLNFTLFFVT